MFIKWKKNQLFMGSICVKDVTKNYSMYPKEDFWILHTMITDFHKRKKKCPSLLLLSVKSFDINQLQIIMYEWIIFLCYIHIIISI